MTAARDGVDRFGSPALGGSSNATSSGVASPPSADQRGGANDGPGVLAAPVPHTAGNLNGNLRNIGKFFKRDMSTFGRFGGSKGGEEAS